MRPRLISARPPLVSLDEEDLSSLDRPTPLYPEPPPRPTTALRDRAALFRMDGPTAGEAIVLSMRGVRFGRGRDADVRIDDDSVSRIHASIHHDGVGYVLTDLGSLNGTSVHGQRIDRHTLRDGDLIQLGHHQRFRFSLIDGRQEELFKQLFETSTRDVMTGAYNRNHFEERLRTEVAYAVRHGSDLGIVLFDLDHFKSINDTYGHPAGDAVLKHVAAVVSSRLRTEDIFARYGGEEFVVVLRGISLPGVARAAERLRGAIAGARPTFDGQLVPVTISAGCASLGPGGPQTGAELLAEADRRLYEAKRSGRNRVVSSG